MLSSIITLRETDVNPRVIKYQIGLLHHWSFIYSFVVNSPPDRITQVLYITVNYLLISLHFKESLPINIMRVEVFQNLNVQSDSVTLLLCLTDSD
jgi:hypothetical protein